LLSRSLLAAAAALLVAASAPQTLSAQPAPNPSADGLSAPDQALIDDFVGAVNGDAAARARFLDQHVAANPRMPRAQFTVDLEAIARTSRGIAVRSVLHRPGLLRLTVAAANGKVGRIDLRQSEADPTRLNAFGGVAVPTPYDGGRLSAAVPRAELVQAIDRRVRFAVGHDDFSGAVLVMKGDEVIYAKAFGEADRQRHQPNTLETRFNLGSMGKQFTAVAIGQLIEAGKLTLDTRLIEVLPDYPNPEAARKITIRQLLSHAAGLGMLFERPGWNFKLRYQTMGELLPIFARAPLQFEPGTRSAYSNEGFIVLGAVVEKLSGQTWYDYVQTNVFERAGMTHSGHLTDDPAIPNRATGYKFADDDALGFGARKANWDSLSWRGNSCGGGYSTVGDMIRFLRALKAGKLISPRTAALFTAQAAGGLPDYGLGFQRIATPGGRTLVGHDGGGPASGINADAKMVWETGYAWAVLGNYDAPFIQAVGRDIGDMLAVQD
jgi:CubicO group peptidase (beta-lactamase class C family)